MIRKFNIELFVDNSWIEDGFDAHPAAIKEALLEKCLPYAHDREVRVRVTKLGAVDKIPEDAV